MTTYNKDKNTRIDYIDIRGSPMDKEIYSIEGINIEVGKIDKTDADYKRQPESEPRADLILSH